MDLVERLRGSRLFGADALRESAAIVTGGGSGLGRGIALGLALCGARVAVVGRRPDRLEAVVGEIESVGGVAVALTCDVRDAEAIARTVADATSALGSVDLLVNSAGATFTVASEELTPNGFRAVVETDAFGTFFMCQAVARRLLAAGTPGAMLNITSTSPITGNPGRLAGGVGKAGVDSMTKSLATEWGPRGIRLNSLAPGYTPTTGVNAATLLADGDDDRLAARARSVPLRRVGEIADIVWPAVFLLSPAASYITGTALIVDGGKVLASGRSFDAAAPTAN